MKRRKEFKIVSNPKIDIEKVYSVYSGKKDGCMCGCCGIWRYPSNEKMKKIAEIDRGYEIDKKEISDSFIKKVVKIISNAKKVEVINDSFTTIINERQYTLYIKK